MLHRTVNGLANKALLTTVDSSGHRLASRLRRTRNAVTVAQSLPQATPVSTRTTDAATFLWSSHVSRRINLDLAVEEAVSGALKGRQEGWAPELAVVFLSSAYVAEYSQLISQLQDRVPSLKYIVGSTGYGVIGTTHDGPEEIEHAPALSVALATLPGVQVSITHVTSQQLPDGDAPPQAWADMLGVDINSHEPTNFIMLADPEFSGLMELTAGLDFAFSQANKIGGLTSAGKLSPARAMFAWTEPSQDQQQQQQAGQPQLQQQQQQQASQQGQEQQQFAEQPLQQRGPDPLRSQSVQQVEQKQQQTTQRQQLPELPMLRTGAVVLSLQGPLQMELIVAQGCRPLSNGVYTIDKVATRGPLVLALKDEATGRTLTPVQALQQELGKVVSSRTELLQLLRNMALGLMPEVLRAAEGPPLEPQDFLIRGMALDKSGFMVVGDNVRVGQRIRFMLRDRAGAQQDLTNHCLAYKRRELAAMLGGSTPPPHQAFGMLLFSCNGRGMNLYDQPSYDSRTLASYIPVPCSGFMCNGEIGTIAGTTHLHGFTCAAAVLRAAAPSSKPSGIDSTADSSSHSNSSADGQAGSVN